MSFEPLREDNHPLPWLKRVPATREPGERRTTLTHSGEPDEPATAGHKGAPALQPAEPGQTQALAESEGPTPTEKLRLSDILREAQAPAANAPAETQLMGSPSLTGQTAVPAVRISRPADELPFPSLLERVRDPKTDPYLDLMPEAARADDVDQEFRELEKLPPARDHLADLGPTEYVEPPPTRKRRFSGDSTTHAGWRIPAVLLLAGSVALFIMAFSGWVVTREDEAEEVNARIIGQLTEVDRYLATNAEAIRDAEPDESGRVALPNYPLPVTLSEEEAASLETAELRDVILVRGAALTYDQGVSAYGSESGIFDDLSTPGLVRAGIDVMQESNHSRLLLATLFLGALTLGATVVVVAATSGAGRISAPGIALIIGGLGALLMSLAMRFMLDQAAGGDDVLSDGLGDIAADASFLFIRNSLVFVVAGVLISIAGVAIAYFDRESGKNLPSVESEPVAARR
jgi:hypothetical protein